MKRNKTVLVTGGAGFIGSHLVEELLQKGQKVIVVDNLSTGSLKNIEHLKKNKEFHFIKGSILDENLMEDLIKKVDQIYHLAAVVGVRMVLGKPLNSLLTNIKGTEIVLKEAAKRKTKILLASSSEVCGKDDNIPFGEEDDRTYGSVYNDRWVYAFAKGVDEFLGLAYWREKKLPVVIVRLFNVIGPRQTGRYGMVVPTFVKQALSKGPITVFGDGKQTRCFADIQDVVIALVKLMVAKNAEGHVTNLGSDYEISINQLAKKVKGLTGNYSSEIIYVPYKKAYPDGYEDFRRRVPNISKIKKTINYRPSVGLEESIKRIIKYYDNK
ncbi:MAG: SDR family NAD(P)-dependent oxidoreductase [Patescibacteria group bacterium]|nr:SDR family NAD(P)-dependent oxidoreductase [Patescibacteria group bacterium]